MHPTFPRTAAPLVRILSLATVFGFAAAPTVFATSFTITSGTNTTARTLNSGETGSVSAGATLSVSGGTTAVANNGGSTLSVDGTIQQTGSGRAIRSGTDLGAISVSIGANGVVKAVGDDAFQARGGFVTLVNNGTMYSGPNLALPNPAGVIATGRAFNGRDAAGGNVTNGLTGVMRADGADAVRVGSNFTFTNLGIILANGRVNDNSANNAFNSPPNNSTAETFSASDGFSFEDQDSPLPGVSNSSLVNSGSISGARHGVEAGTRGTNLTVTNNAGGSIVGRNGSGVGFDTTEADATRITVNNAGLIRGEFAGVGNVIDRTGNPGFTQDGDGDGVDIDGAATINNLAGGQILGAGANGYDTGGRANTSDGISIGGGVINNSGLIQGAGIGIVVNNDANASRSGVAATTITNHAGGTIAGLGGYAIRLENKLGDARDNDVITNAGTIIGGGAIPNPAATVLRQNGLFDPNSTGTLDGVAYTGTGAARFIQGDGSAIQMGEGNDVLNNSGAITGTNGRAINLEGGNDTLNVTGGVINGAINGGAGSDTLNFNLGSPAAAFVQNGAITNLEHIEVQSGRVQLSGDLSLGSDGNTLAVFAPGILDLGSGALAISQGSVVVDGTLKFVLGGSSSYGQLLFDAANLGGLTLTSSSLLDLDLGYNPLVGTQFTLVDFLGGGSYLSGTFAGLAEGAFFQQEGAYFQISYLGNGGHDIVITRTVPDATATLALLLVGFCLIALARALRRRNLAAKKPKRRQANLA